MIALFRSLAESRQPGKEAGEQPRFRQVSSWRHQKWRAGRAHLSRQLATRHATTCDKGRVKSPMSRVSGDIGLGFVRCHETLINLPKVLIYCLLGQHYWLRRVYFLAYSRTRLGTYDPD